MFITFEGPEGSGKTTQVKRAEAYLSGRGFKVTCTREPGGTPVADKVRRILVDADNATLVPMAELFLYFASRAQHVAEKIRPALLEGQIVLCDRYADSTLAYQGYARGLDVEMVARLNELATGGLQPDLTLLLDLSVEVGLARARVRADGVAPREREDRFEQEEIEFHRRLREGYLKLAGEFSGRYRVIDATPGVDEVWTQTKFTLDVALERWRR